MPSRYLADALYIRCATVMFRLVVLRDLNMRQTSTSAFSLYVFTTDGRVAYNV